MRCGTRWGYERIDGCLISNSRLVSGSGFMWTLLPSVIILTVVESVRNLIGWEPQLGLGLSASVRDSRPKEDESGRCHRRLEKNSSI